MGRGRLTHALALALVAANAQACTRDPDLFEAVDHDENVGGSPAQLTFSSVNDRSPAWSAAGDSIYYSAEGGGHLPPDRGVLVGIPVAGGVSERILTNAQLEGDGLEHWLVTPALAPDGESLAFVEILSLWDPHPCVLGLTVLFCLPISDEADVRRPPVRQIALHARRFDATEPLETDPTLTLFMPGVTLDTVPNPPLRAGVAGASPHAHLTETGPDRRRISWPMTKWVSLMKTSPTWTSSPSPWTCRMSWSPLNRSSALRMPRPLACVRSR